MTYFLTFLEGIITFISPCLLPMLPVYISYFAAGELQEQSAPIKRLPGACGFAAGFSAMFMAMGALAGALGSLLSRYGRVLDIICGAVVICFGLSYLGVIRLPAFGGNLISESGRKGGFWSSFLFGIAFSVGWTPCVGAFLGSALMLASQQGSVLGGVMLLLCYSLGLALPFVISAVIIGTLKDVFGFIKRNYRYINPVCGAVLILVGLLMASGRLQSFLAKL